MFFWNNKEKKYKWEPVATDAQTILKLIDECVHVEAPICRLIIKYNDRTYNIGVTSDCESKGRYDQGRFFDIVYYIDDNEYNTFEEFKRAMDIENTPFEELEGVVYIVADEDIDDPRNYTMIKNIK